MAECRNCATFDECYPEIAVPKPGIDNTAMVYSFLIIHAVAAKARDLCVNNEKFAFDGKN